MQDSEKTPRWLGPVALVIFALSGCSGLIYQSIWSQYLGLYLGHAAYAQSLVLAIFMGGMAIGAWWASRSSLQWRNLLRAYALIELVIGVAAALFHPAYLALTHFAYDTAFPNLPGAASVQVFKWCSGALLILPQAVLLGMTFPLMSSGLMRRLRTGDGAILGGLYFTNSMGAAVGALIATFLLLPRVGLPGAMQFGALINVLVALAAFLAAGSTEPPRLLGEQQDNSRRGSAAHVLLIAAFITGATSFVYEIGWVRMLSLVFGSTVHAFELMLAAFIGGLAFGGLWIRRRIDGYAAPLRVGGWVQVLMGLAALLSLVIYDRAFDWTAWFMHALSRSNGGYDLYNTVTAGVSMVLMAPAAFFAGMTLPLFTLALIRAGGGEASIGRIYAANTVGAIAGVFAAVHLLVPGLGLKLAMILAAAGDLVLGLVLLRRERTADRSDFAYLGALLLCGGGLAASLILARFDPAAMGAGVFRTGSARLNTSVGEKVLFYRDGKTASVSVRTAPDGTRSIATNGKVDAGIRLNEDGKPAPDEITMVMAGVMPLVHHANPRSVAVIGFGSGLTTHTLLGDPRLERVDTIEIEPAMIEGAKLFGSHVERAYKDPRSHLHIEDARTYFAAHRSRYDVIVSEPSNPWVSGVASLFSQEFYEFIPRHLAPGGLFVQWVQLYEINDELVASVVRALSTQFRDYRVYLTYNSDMLIVARADGPVEDLRGDALATPGLHEELVRLDIGSLDEIRAHEIGRRRDLSALFDAMSTRTNSDFYPHLSLEAPRARFTAQQARAIITLPVADLPYRDMLTGLPPARTSAVAASPSYRYTSVVHTAKEIADSLKAGRLPEQSGEDAVPMAYLYDVVGHCAPSASDVSVPVQLVILAGRTVPFLEPDSLQGAWIDPAWVHCAGQPAPQPAMLQLISALGRRDGTAVKDLAQSLLDPAGKLRESGLREWVLRSAMLGAIAAHDYAAVAQLEARYGKNIVSVEPDASYRRWMELLAARRSAATPTP